MYGVVVVALLFAAWLYTCLRFDRGNPARFGPLRWKSTDSGIVLGLLVVAFFVMRAGAS